MSTVTWEEYEPIPIGEYQVEITSIDVGASQFIDVETGKPKEQVTWKLMVSEGEYQGEKLMTWTSVSASLKGNLAKYAKACGVDIQAGTSFDIVDLVGRKCKAVVLVKEKEDGTKFNKVEELKPLRSTSIPPTATAKPDEKQQWTCLVCGDQRILTAAQIEIVNQKYDGRCKTCYEGGTTIDDPFARDKEE